MRPKNVSTKREEKHRNLEAAILRDLSKRTPYNATGRKKTGMSDAELIKEWQWTDSFSTRYLLKHLRKLYLYPFSAVYHGFPGVYLSFMAKDRKEHTARLGTSGSSVSTREA